MFLDEAKKYDVFPLDPRLAERLDSRNPHRRRAADELDVLRQQRPAARADRPDHLPELAHHHRRR